MTAASSNRILKAAIFLVVLTAFLVVLTARGADIRADPSSEAMLRIPITDATELIDIYSDSTMYGRYVYRGVSGEVWSEYHCANGKTVYNQGSLLLAGRWWIEAPKVCFEYETEGKQVFEQDTVRFCFEVSRDVDGRYYSRNTAEPGVDTWSVIEGYRRGDFFNLQRLKGMACEAPTS